MPGQQPSDLVQSVQRAWLLLHAFRQEGEVLRLFSGLNTTARFDPTRAQVNASGQFTSARNPRIMQLALRFFF
jgi:hypothetical protein